MTTARTERPDYQTAASVVGSPLEALERDELVRTRHFCVVAFAISGAGGLAVMLLPGDPTAAMVLLSALGIAIAAIVFLLRRTADPIAFRNPTTALGWFIPAACVTTALPFFGVFSPAPVILVLGVYFTGLGRNTKLAYAVYVTCAGTQAILSLLVIGHVVRDTGLIHMPAMGTSSLLVVQGLVQFVLAATIVTARLSRRTALDAVVELERAVRIAAHGQALLLEAREELQRALRSGRGRFTEQLLGSYELGTVIGHGAMGEVYEAKDTRSGAIVAVKLLSQASLGNHNHVMRFMRELRTAATVVSPNVVAVLDVGESPLPYLVMERLYGNTLSELLRNRRALEPSEALDLVQQLGAGITAAAAAGVVHRDLKPQNVFLDTRGERAPSQGHRGAPPIRGVWKILDFGVARAIDQGDTLTAGHVVGTPSYMAPEQATGGEVDHCTDLYALAAVAYRALTGFPPFAAGELAETLYKVVHTRPRAPTVLAPRLSDDVDLCLAIGLAHRPQDRFVSGAEFAQALASALDSKFPDDLRARAEALLDTDPWSIPARPSSRRTRQRTARERP